VRGAREIGSKPGHEARWYARERKRLVGSNDALKPLGHRATWM
jgi:hypothetical protein